MTSGPMPSPGRISSCLFAVTVGVLPRLVMSLPKARGTSAPSAGRQPGPAVFLPLFVALDRRRFFQGQTDIVEPVQQTMLAERVDLEGDRMAVGPADRLLLEIDGEDCIGAILGIRHQGLDRGG